MATGKRHITTTDSRPLTTSDGRYVVVEAEIDPADLKISTPRGPRYTHRTAKRSATGFTGPYRH